MAAERTRPDKDVQIEELTELRADHIPEDVLAEADAEKRILRPEDDPLAHLTGVSGDEMAELDVASRAAEVGALTPTDDEVVDSGPDE